jgi:Tfp pilus assembly protein PilF
LPLLLLLLATTLLYSRTLSYGFVYDDFPQIVNNPRIESWHSFGSLFTHHLWAQQIAAAQGNYYRPLLLVWMMLNYWLFHAAAAGWHATSLLLQLLAGTLVWLTTKELTRDKRTALIAAAIFLLHPLMVESTVWVSDANEPLCLVFLLASLLLLTRAADSRRRLALSLLLFALALLTKETAIVFVLCVFAYKAVFEVKETRRESIFEATKTSCGFAVVALVYFTVRRLVLGTAVLNAPPATSVGSSLLTLPSVLLTYVRNIAFPARLALFYDTPYLLKINSHFAFAAMALIALAGLGLWLCWREKSRACAFGLLWGILLLGPSLYGIRYFADLGLVHDRYIYSSMAGFSIFAAVIAAPWLRKPPGIKVAAVVAIAGCALTLQQQNQWQSEDALYTRAAEVAPSSPAPWLLLANLKLAERNITQAQVLIDRSLALNPNYVAGRLRRASLFIASGLLPQAEADLQVAMTLRPDRADVHAWMAKLRWSQGRTAEAVVELKRAITMFPENLDYRIDLAHFYLESGDTPSAIAQYRAALQVAPHETELRTAILVLERRSTLQSQKPGTLNRTRIEKSRIPK